MAAAAFRTYGVGDGFVVVEADGAVSIASERLVVESGMTKRFDRFAVECDILEKRSIEQSDIAERAALGNVVAIMLNVN